MDIYAEAQRRGILLHQEGREFHGNCVFGCGGDGNGRLIVWPEGNYWCRVCGSKGFLDDDKPGWKPDPVLAKRHEEETLRLHNLRLEKQRKWQNNGALKEIEQYHEALQPCHRDWWRRRGFTEAMIEYYSIGYCPNKRIKVADDYQTVEAYTIPVLSPFTGLPTNLQYRIFDPVPQGVGKYRQMDEFYNSIFYAGPQTEGDLIIVEGATKAAVLYEYIQRKWQVAGLPGITPRLDLIQELDCFRRKLLLPDPGVSEKQIQRFAVLPHLTVVKMPSKPDDAVVQGMTRDHFRTLVRLGRKLT